MEPASYIDRWLGRMRWLSIVLVVTLLTSIGLPVALPVNPVLASPDSWTQTTFSDFYEGSEKDNVLVVIVASPDDADVKLAYELTSGLMNWTDPVEVPTPGSKLPIYGDRWVAQTFTADASGSVHSIVIYVVKEGSPPGDLIVELWNTASSKPATLIPGASESATIGEAGVYEVEFSTPPAITAGTEYAIVLHQAGDLGDNKNCYIWYYDDSPGYLAGKAWKSNTNGTGWLGHGFGNHDFGFIVNALTQYYSSGYLVSSAHDTGYDADFGTISWHDDTPTGTTLKFQIRTAATESGLTSTTWYGPTSTSDYYETSGTAINSVHNGDQWVQYKAYFETTDTSVTPVLHDVTIEYSQFNTAPVAVDDGATVAEGATVTVVNGTDPGVLANDTDAEGDPLTAALVTGPSYASSFTLNGDGSFRAMPTMAVRPPATPLPTRLTMALPIPILLPLLSPSTPKMTPR